MCKRMMVVVLGLGLLVIPVVMAQETAAVLVEPTVLVEPAEPSEINQPLETTASEASAADPAASADLTTTDAENLPVATAETMPEGESEKDAETTSSVTDSGQDSQAPDTGAEQLETADVSSVPEAEALPSVTSETTPENSPEKDAEIISPVADSVQESQVETTSEAQTETVSEAQAETSVAEESPEPSTAETPVSFSVAPSIANQQSGAVDKQPKADSESEEMVGIDTINVDEPAGNWLYKRLYWERAEDKYQKIKELMAAVFDARSRFFEQRVQLDKDIFDPLYTLASFRRGELSAILKELLDDIEKQKQHKDELDDSARVLFAKVEANKERLEEVKKEIEFIGKIDAAVDEAINTLIGLLNQGRNFEMQAWNDFKAISRELSDKKARDLFYRIDTYWRNIKDIQLYITTKLAEHMSYLASSAQQHADTVKELLKTLESQGFVLKEQVDALEKSKSIGADSAEQDDEVVTKTKKKSEGFFAKIGKVSSWVAQPFVAIAKALWHTIAIPFNYFFGYKKLVKLEQVPAVPEVLEKESSLETAPAGPEEVLAGESA